MLGHSRSITVLECGDPAIESTIGSALASEGELSTHQTDAVIPVGELSDNYSAFYDNGHRQSTGLMDCLREHGVREVYLLGLATDYCVKFSALDARQLGFTTTVIEDGCRGVGLHERDVANAIEEMRVEGVDFRSSSEV